MLTDLQKLLGAAILLNGAVFSVLAFVAGVMTGNPMAWKMAIATVGWSWVCYAAEYLSGGHAIFRGIAVVACILSIAFGVIAAQALLWGS